MLGLSIYAFSLTSFEWWWYPLLFFLPDIGIAGYLGGNRAGAAAYNLLHHKGTSVVLWFLGASLGINAFLLLGIVFFGHSSFDRVFGFGLKYGTGFRFTHLGEIGKSAQK